MPQLLCYDGVHNDQDDDEDNDNGLYNQNHVTGTDSESHSNTSYHSSEENQHDESGADQVRLGMVYGRPTSEARNENRSIVTKLNQQQILYDTGPLEDYCSDTEKCLQRYFKTIYRQVKFFSDSKEDIKCPNFVVAENSNSSEMKQIVQICTWLLTNTGKGHYGLDQKIMFWKTYWRMIYKEISKLRMGDTNKFKTRFIKGTFQSLNANDLFLISCCLLTYSIYRL